MSPDPYSGSYDVNDPQSMNRYTYVLNNPLAYVDPDGLLQVRIGPCVFEVYSITRYTSSNLGEKVDDLGYGYYLIGCNDNEGNFNYSYGYQTSMLGGGGGGGGGARPPAPRFDATISAYHPSVSQCLGEAAIDAGLDFTSLSVLPGANQDSWRWQSAGWNSGFFYTGAAADSAIGTSTGVDALEKGADWVESSPWAQGEIRQFLRSQGAKWSVKHISKDAAWLGKWAGRVGGALALYSGYQRYQKCRGY